MMTNEHFNRVHANKQNDSHKFLMMNLTLKLRNYKISDKCHIPCYLIIPTDLNVFFLILEQIKIFAT